MFDRTFQIHDALFIHAQIGLLQGFNVKFPMSSSPLFVRECPPPPGKNSRRRLLSSLTKLVHVYKHANTPRCTSTNHVCENFDIIGIQRRFAVSFSDKCC